MAMLKSEFRVAIAEGVQVDLEIEEVAGLGGEGAHSLTHVLGEIARRETGVAQTPIHVGVDFVHEADVEFMAQEATASTRGVAQVGAVPGVRFTLQPIRVVAGLDANVFKGLEL